MSVLFKIKGRVWTYNDIWETAEPRKISREEFDHILVEKVEKGFNPTYVYRVFNARQAEGYVLFDDKSYLYIDEDDDDEQAYYEVGEYELVDIEEWG